MGSVLISCANSDFFRDLLLKYGEMFIRLIVSQKMRIMLEQKFKQVMEIIKKYMNDFVREVNQIVDEKIKQLTEIFEELKRNVEEMFPGRIAELEAKRGAAINQFTGFSEFLLKIDEVRDNALARLQEVYKQVTGELIQKKAEMRKQIQEQRPHIPLYDSLSDKNKNRVFRKAQQQFGQQIEKAQRAIEKKCDSNFSGDVTKMKSVFDSVNPDSYLTQFLMKCAKEMLGKLGGGVCAGCLEC